MAVSLIIAVWARLNTLPPELAVRLAVITGAHGFATPDRRSLRAARSDENSCRIVRNARSSWAPSTVMRCVPVIRLPVRVR
jgi:hypothetical protein